MTRPNGDVVINRADTLDIFGNVFSLGFLIRGVHKPAQLTGSAINVHVDLVEFIFGVVAQCVTDLMLQCFIINILASAACILISGTAGKRGRADGTGGHQAQTQGHTYDVSFIFHNFSFVVSCSCFCSKAEAYAGASQSKTVCFSGGKVAGISKNTEVGDYTYLKAKATASDDLVNVVELIACAAKDVGGQTRIADRDSQYQISGSCINKSATVPSEGISICAHTNILRKEEVGTGTGRKVEVFPGNFTVMEIMLV